MAQVEKPLELNVIINEILSKLKSSDERDSEYIRRGIQTRIDVIQAHLIEGLEHREIDEETLKCPLNSKGKVETSGSISSRMLYVLGIKGTKENSKQSLFIGIFKNKDLGECISILKMARNTNGETPNLNTIINLFQLSKITFEDEKLNALLKAYDKLYLAKINSLTRILKKNIESDILLKCLLENNSAFNRIIEINDIPVVLKNIVINTLKVIEEGNINDFSTESQELYAILNNELIIETETGINNNYLLVNNGENLPTTEDEDEEINKLSSQGKRLIEVSTPPSQSDIESKVSNRKNSKTTRIGRKRDYESEQKKNKKIGFVAEQLVLENEIIKLIEAGRQDLVNNVEHISETQGDGLGYDIKSFEVDGTPIFIEVKGSIEVTNKDFFISESEVEFSRNNQDNFYIYRVYNLNDSTPYFFKIKGDVESNFNLTPITYTARMK